MRQNFFEMKQYNDVNHLLEKRRKSSRFVSTILYTKLTLGAHAADRVT
jgi:hypothetical protein